MKPKNLLAMFVLTAVLGGFIFFYEKDLPSTDERRVLAKKVIPLEADEIDRVTIAWQDQRVLLLREKKQTKEDVVDDAQAAAPLTSNKDLWWLKEPFETQADGDMVQQLLDKLTGLEKSRTLDQVGFEEAGLQEPQARVTLSSEKGERRLNFGFEAPASTERMVALGDQKQAYLVDGSVFTDLTREPGAWREKRLLTKTRQEIDKLILHNPEGQVTLSTKDDTFWVESPIKDLADEDLTNSLLNALKNLAVTSFIDNPVLPLEAMGLEPPIYEIEVFFTDAQPPFSLALGNPVEEKQGVLYGRAKGQLFEIEHNLLESAERSVNSWRSHAWTTQQVFQIDSLKLLQDSREILLQRDGADWKRGADRIEYSVATDLLYTLSEAKAQEILTTEEAMGNGYSLDEPQLSIRLSTSEKEEVLKVFDSKNGLVAATSADRDVVLLLEEGMVDDLLQKLTDVEEAVVISDEEAEAESAQEE